MVVAADKQHLIIKRNVRLREYTTLKIGGYADYFFVVDNEGDLAKIRRDYKNSFYLLGAGSNILVSDIKLNKPIVKLGEGFNYIKEELPLVEVGASTHLCALINYKIKNNMSGLENLAGIPATIGGLLCMNAASFGGAVSSVLEKVKVMNREGDIFIFERDKLEFSYRSSPLKDYTILSGWFKLEKDSGVKTRTKRFLRERYNSQDFSYPSCGCIFKNPPCLFSGALIEGCGLKGRRWRGAAISVKHANFIVNLGGASYNDVDYLINLAKEKVYKKYNAVLEEEICRWE